MFDSLPIMLLRIPCVFLAISVHESAHGWAAEKLGDPTARRMGRISLNPARHFNLLGTLCMIFLGFGWATPVPINISNFKKPKRDMALSAIAGPISNLILMVIGCLFHRLALLLFVQIGWMIPMGGLLYYGTEGSLRSVMDAILLFFTVFASLNASLAVFNMIPIPPLDGSRLLTAILPTDKYFKLMRYERYLLAALLILLFTGSLGGLLSSVTGTVIDGAFSLLDLIPFLRIGG